MSGDYRSKKEVAHLLVPSVGRKVIDLGGNLEKGEVITTGRYSFGYTNNNSTDHEVDWQLVNPWCYRDHGRKFNAGRKGWDRY